MIFYSSNNKKILFVRVRRLPEIILLKSFPRFLRLVQLRLVQLRILRVRVGSPVRTGPRLAQTLGPPGLVPMASAQARPSLESRCLTRRRQAASGLGAETGVCARPGAATRGRCVSAVPLSSVGRSRNLFLGGRLTRFPREAVSSRRTQMDERGDHTCKSQAQRET